MSLFTKIVEFFQDPPALDKSKMVRDFHILINSPFDRRLDDCYDVPTSRTLSDDVQDDLSRWAAHFIWAYKQSGDVRNLRAHLLLEEVGEVLKAMGDLNEVSLLDGLADLDYVMHGTAVAFSLPLDRAFVEVHRSNMTKRVQDNDPDAVRCREKGSEYSPPDLARVLQDYRHGR